MGATHGKRISQSEPHDPEWVEQYQIETLDYHLRSPNYQFRTHTYQLKAAMDQKEAHNYHLGMNSERLIGDIEQL
ncbi:hypothetical protein [Algoriphagus winogradskyi]|nr:hypothetical protein [Algoriphagus winogradskyi]